MKILSHVLLPILKSFGAGDVDDIFWSLTQVPWMDEKFVSGINPVNFVNTLRRRTYDVLSVLSGLELIGRWGNKWMCLL